MILEYTQTASVRSQRDGLQQRGKEEDLEKYGDGPPSKREH